MTYTTTNLGIDVNKNKGKGRTGPTEYTSVAREHWSESRDRRSTHCCTRPCHHIQSPFHVKDETDPEYRICG